MAIPDNYIDKITKGNDSRMISPAADMVRVDNDNFDGETLDEVLDEVAQDISEAGSGAAAGATALQQSDVSVETQGDGTVDINVGSGSNKDTYTINLNHTHPQYLDVDDLDDFITAGTNVTITKDSQTGALEISASGGGGGGITGITLNGNNVTVSGGVAALTDLVQSSNVANIVVCASVTDYNNISPKDSNTLYLIKE